MVIFLAAIHNLTLIEMEQSSNLISSGSIKGWQIAVGQHQEPEMQGTVLEVEAYLILRLRSVLNRYDLVQKRDSCWLVKCSFYLHRIHLTIRDKSTYKELRGVVSSCV